MFYTVYNVYIFSPQNVQRTASPAQTTYVDPRPELNHKTKMRVLGRRPAATLFPYSLDRAILMLLDVLSIGSKDHTIKEQNRDV